MAVLIPSTLTYNKAGAKISTDPNAVAVEMASAALNASNPADVDLTIIVTACEENSRLSFNASTQLGTPIATYAITLKYNEVIKA